MLSTAAAALPDYPGHGVVGADLSGVLDQAHLAVDQGGGSAIQAQVSGVWFALPVDYPVEVYAPGEYTARPADVRPTRLNRIMAAMAALTGRKRPWIPELHPRDAKGRFIKRGGQRSSSWAREVSRRADAAVRAAKPGPGDLPQRAASIGDLIGEDLRDVEYDQVRSYLRNHLAFHDPRTGLRVEVRNIDKASRRGYPGPHQLAVRLDIRDADGRRVGRAVRYWYHDHDGSLAVKHEYLELDEDIQGSGLAARINRRAEALYQANGVKKIALTANMDVGGYAWAKQGYDFSQEHSMLNTAASAGAFLDGGWPMDAATKARFESLIARSTPEHWAAGTAPIPLEWAMAGWKEGEDQWPGKAFMLTHQWEGEKRL